MSPKSNDPFAGFADLQRRISEALHPFAELQEQFKAPVIDSSVLAGLQKASTVH
jgi:hypothetical protein